MRQIKIRILIIGAVAFAMAATLSSAAIACSTSPVVLRGGETVEQNVERTSREAQDRKFRTSALVFVADVVEVTRDIDSSGFGYRYQATIVPQAALKGSLPKKPIHYEFFPGPCTGWTFPSPERPMLFFADAPTSIRGAIDFSRLRDTGLRARAQMAPNRKQDLVERPRDLALSWQWAGMTVLASLVVGFGLGRIRASGRKTKVQ